MTDFGDFPDERPPSPWGRSVWPLLFLVGWLLYELTARPGLAVVTICLKFGWEDFRTARWLRQRDPWRGRGRACFWLYVASALWKVTAASFLLLVAYCIGLAISAGVAHHQGQARPDLGQECAAAALTGLTCSVLAMLATALAVAMALVSGAKLWLDRGVRAERLRDHWPPVDGEYGRRNRIGVMTVALLVTCFLAGLSATVIALAARLPRGPNGKDAPVLFVLANVAVWFAGLGGVYFVQNLLERRVFAPGPEDCWLRTPQGLAPAEDRAQTVGPFPSSDRSA